MDLGRSFPGIERFVGLKEESEITNSFSGEYHRQQPGQPHHSLPRSLHRHQEAHWRPYQDTPILTIEEGICEIKSTAGDIHKSTNPDEAIANSATVQVKIYRKPYECHGAKHL